jgi:protein gp37
MAENSSIEWTQATWNPVTGCTKISPGCAHCLAPETLILHADMKWRPIGDVKPGDRLLGFDEQLELGRNRAIRAASVQKVWRSVQPTIRLRIGPREVITTANHQWLCEPRPWWRPTKRLRLGVRVRVFGGPASNWHESLEYMCGYVAGMTLGDGTFRFDSAWRSDKLGYPQMYWRVAVADREILDRLSHFLAAAGVSIHTRPFSQGNGVRKTMWKVETRAKAKLQVIADMCCERDCADWRAGWLGGMFDAEGSHSGSLRISQKDVTILEQAVEYAASIGIASEIERKHQRAFTLRVTGGAQEKVRFLCAIRPALQRKIDDLFGRRLDASLDEVTAIERLGEREVVDIQTSTGTFIAAGICTHNCYAERMAKRLRGRCGYPTEEPFRVTLHPERLDEPLRWRKPRLVFVNSMSDLFHKDVPLAFVQRVFAVMETAAHHTFQVLTKRPEIAREHAKVLPWPPNVWLGTSVESALYVHRVRTLREIPAQVRFLSLEPLLGPIVRLPLRGIHWVIVGGESGPRARAMNADWVRQIRHQCQAKGVPFFFKQWGGVNKKKAGRKLDGRTWDAMPRSMTDGFTTEIRAAAT